QMPVLAISFIYLIKDDSYKNMTSKAFIINIVVIIISIAISMITNTGEYTYDIYKLGLKGWFSNANSQSIIIVTLIPLALEVLTRKKNILLFSIGTILAWFLMISNGTKVAYLSIYLIFGGFIVYYIMEFFLHRENFKRFNTVAIIAYSLLLVISYVGYDKTPRYEMTHGYESAREEDQAEMDKEFDKMTDGSNPTLDQMLSNPVQREWILKTYDKLINPSLVEKYGTETVLREYGYLPDAWELTDTRAAKILYSDMLYKKSDMLTKLVGFEYSHVITKDGTSFDLENDYHAVFYYYGYLGFGLYIGFLLYFLVLVLKKVIVDFKGAFTSFNFALILTYLVQLGAAQFSGAILRRPNVSIYLSIIVALIYYQCKINKKDETIK
ncbi:MAG: O-antigen ligase family protein, partial [Erysipelotrichaceae bacterium]